MLNTLRVGVPIPNEQPSAGGAFEFQQTVFTEILKRINASKGVQDSKVDFVPIATTPKSAQNWEINSQKVLNVFPSRALRVRSALHRRLSNTFYPWSSLSLRPTLADKAVAKKLNRQVHAIWSLQPGVLNNNLPFILTVWDLQHRLQPFFPEVSRAGTWESRELHYTTIGSKAFLNVVGTNRGSEELQHFYGIDPSRLLVNPFPCPPTVSVSDQAGGELLQRLSLCSGQFLLYPAQFWPHKNHLAALMALRLLIDCGRALKIVFTGSDKGSLKAVEEYVDQLGLKSSVVNAGFVDRHDLAALYSHCFALLYPSFFGPDNIPPLEAMSYRTPALVADVPGAFEQYGDAVLRFNPGEPAQIVDCVNRLYDEPGLRECLIESGLKLISSLTPASYVDRVENFLAAESLPLLCSALM